MDRSKYKYYDSVGLSSPCNEKQTSFKIVGINTFEELAQLIIKYAWSPIIWANGRRNGVNFHVAYFAVLDFDAPGYTLLQCKNDFCDMMHSIGTTKSHQKEKNGVICDRFRLVVLFEEPITDLQLYRHNLRQLADQYEADIACVDGARFFYPCKEIVSLSDEGFTLEIKPLPVKHHSDEHLNSHSIINDRIVPDRVRHYLKHGIRPGGRNDGCFIIGIELFKHGFNQAEMLNIVKNSAIQPIDDFKLEELQRALLNGYRFGQRIYSQQ